MLSQTQTNVQAIKDEQPFTSELGDVLFRLDGGKDLRVGVIRKTDDTTSGLLPLGFCLANSKAFPQGDTLYSNVTDKNSPDWTWTLVDGTEISKDALKYIDKTIYAFNYVFEERMGDYGLSVDDTMSLYHAAQLTLWTFTEKWTPDMIVKKEETIANPELNALADKIYDLYLDMYEYAKDDSTETFKEGAYLYNVDSSKAADGQSYNLEGTTQYVAENGTTYYRSPKMRLRPNQNGGVVWDGDFAFTYKVTLENAPEGSRVVNENGVPQDTFSIKPGTGTDFYVEIPVQNENAGTAKVNITTTEFRRMDSILWLPISSSAFQPLLQVAAKPDKTATSFEVEYPAAQKGVYAKVTVNKTGSQVSSVSSETVNIGGKDYTLNTLNFEDLPLKDTEFIIKMGRDKAIYNGTDGETYYRGGKLIPSPVGHEGSPTDNSGKVIFTNLPMDADADTTTYIVEEVKTSNGYILGESAEKTVTVTKDNNAASSLGSVDFNNDRVKFNFSVKKTLAVIGSGNTLDESEFKPAEGVKFGVFSNDTITAADGTSIKQDSLLMVLESDKDGNITFNGEGLPAGHKYYLMELETVEGYELDTNKYFIDATNATNGSTVAIKDDNDSTVNEIVNYPKRYQTHIVKQVQSLKETPSLGLIDSFEYIVQNSGEGYEFGIYSDQECQNLLHTVTFEDFENGSFKSDKLYSGTYYLKELKAPNGQEINENPVQVQIGTSDVDITIQNELTKGQIVIDKYDITNHMDDPDNAPKMSGVKFVLKYNNVIIDEGTTDENGQVVFDNVPLGYKYTIEEDIPVGYVSDKEKTEVDMNTQIVHIRVNNYLSDIHGSVKVVKTGEGDQLLSGVQFAIYDVTDEKLESPLIIDITDEKGEIHFDNLSNKEYLIKEVKAKDGYIPSDKVYTANLTEIKDGDEITINVTNELYYGNVKLIKVDQNDETKTLEGATYGLYNENGDLIEEKTTNENGEIIFSKQPYGSKLHIKEVAAPDGYYLSDQVFEVEINDITKTYYEVIAKDQKYQLDLIVKKVDNDTNDPLMNAEFTLYYKNDIDLERPITKVVTNADGEATIYNLPLGEYVLVETVAPDGYEKYGENIPLNVSEEASEGKVLEITVYNKTEEIPTPDEETPDKPDDEVKPPVIEERPYTGVESNILNVVSIIALLGGLTLLIYAIYMREQEKDDTFYL